MSNVLPFSRDQRRSTRAGRGLGARAKTESPRLTKRSVEADRLHLEFVDDSGRPRTRGDCAGAPRPCPWISCRHNLFLDADENNGSIKFNFPDLEPDQVPAEKSCALDVADLGGATLENVADTMNVTRERVRQVEEKALVILRSRSRTRGTAAKVLSEFSDAPPDAVFGHRGNGSGSVFSGRVDGAQREDEDFGEEEAPTRVSFFADPDSERVDDLVITSVWNMFARWQNGRGFDCRSKGSIAASKYHAQRRAADGAERKAPKHIEEEEEMTKEEFAAAHAAYKKAHGRAPTAAELFDAIGHKEATSISNVRQAIKRAGLVLTGARGPNAPKDAVRKAAPPPATRKPGVVEPKPPRPTSADPLIANLISKRDDFRRKADALDTAIEALSVAL